MLCSSFIEELKSKNILVVGITLRSGVSISNTLFRLNIKHSLTDIKTIDKLKDECNALMDKNATIFAGVQDESILKNIDLIILSPGVALASKFIQIAINKNIEVIGEIEFAYRLIPFNNYICITGTDGKTTTSTLIYEILKKHSKTTLKGNIGDTFSKVIKYRRIMGFMKRDMLCLFLGFILYSWLLLEQVYML